ncbi:Phosphatidylethanolamine-binding protein 4 [Collichthys lucidus]|uniref:Phosphatidylethanolamine-binding protein 4 n=1 Tax=Collichthys lucidus TaxID=240159 RepID=A0A4U5UUT7_COLLU|nr:Phosphatidylethanolamine-binding protein 4 [Collichthys lucidus]
MKKREDKGTGVLIGSCMDDTVKLAEPGSIAQAALLERRLDISLILIPSRVHSKKTMYVLVMVDPDAPSRTKPTSAYWRHWLVVNIQGNALKKGEIQGTTLTDYYPPKPPQDSGFHRYQFMLFEQLPDVPVSLSEREKSSRGKWDLEAFVTRFNLGKPVAVLQFLTQNYND